MKSYLLTAPISGLLAVALYAVATFINSNTPNPLYGGFCLLAGIATGLYIVFLFRRKYEDIYTSPKYKTWMILFLLLNQYGGIISGLFVGVIASWLLLFPYSIIFGHPEGSSKWSPAISNLFMSLSALIMVISLWVFNRWFFKGSITYLRKKTR